MSRTELLVVVAVLLVLGAVLWIPIRVHFEQAEINRAVESARTINTVLFQYANDNNGVYPVGEGTQAVGKSEGIARNLLENNYVPDASAFAVGSTAKYAGKASDFSDIAAGYLSWDFTAGATATMGLTIAAPDLLPIVYTTGESVTYPAVGGSDLALSGNGPFGKKGVVVAYKGGNAAFIPATASAAAVVCPGFISADYKGTGAYTQIRP